MMGSYSHQFTFTQEETRLYTIQSLKEAIQGLKEFGNPNVIRQHLVKMFKNQDSTKHRKGQSFEEYKNKRTLHSCGLMSGAVLKLVIDSKEDLMEFDNDVDIHYILSLCYKNELTKIREFLFNHKGYLNFSYVGIIQTLHNFIIAMEGNDTVTELRFPEQGLIRELCTSLFNNTTLQVLDISNNCLKPHDISDGIIPLLKRNRTIHTLSLYDCYINEMEGIAEALKTNTTLTSLNLGRNDLSVNDLKLLCNALNHNNHITDLDLQQNDININGAIELAMMLQVNPHITSLNLRFNYMDEIEPIAMALHTNQTLKKLDLGNNQFGDEGAIALASAIAVNTSLTDLTLYLNHINDTGAIALAEALRINRTVTSIFLQNNNIGKAGEEAFAQTEMVNPVLTMVYINTNPYL